MSCYKKLVKHKEIKILLLGSENSGKTTIAKQMRMNYGNAYDKNERAVFTKYIWKNVFMNMHNLIDAMALLGISFESTESSNKAKLVKSVIIDTIPHLSTCPYLDLIDDLWQDYGIQKCFQKRQEFHLMENAQYYFEKMNEICLPTYLPTYQDILQVYIPTEQIVEDIDREINFKIEHTPFYIIDVGGLKSERRKWIYCIESVCAVIFVAALSDYDQVFDGQNKLEESIQLFHVIVDWFRNHSIILFMNKKDIFERKIQEYKNLKDYFPKLECAQQDVAMSRELILRQFLNIKRRAKTISSPNLFDFSDSDLCYLDLCLKSKLLGEKSSMYQNQYLYAHYTCAVDTENMSHKLDGVKNAIADTIINQNLEDLLIM